MTTLSIYGNIDYYVKANIGTIWDANVANQNSIQQLVGLNPFLPYPYNILFNRNYSLLSRL